MHEYSLACDVFENVMDVARANNAQVVKSITLKIGKLAHINPEQLLFSFEAVAQGSIAEGATMNVEPVSPSVECNCGYITSADEYISETKTIVEDGFEGNSDDENDNANHDGDANINGNGNSNISLIGLHEYMSLLSYMELKCPACGAVARLTGGRDLVIQTIDIENGD